MEKHEEIQSLRGKIERLAGQTEEDVRRTLLERPPIDSFRVRSVLRFYEQGFTASRSEAWITESVEMLEEVERYWLDGYVNPSSQPQPQTALEEARLYGRITQRRYVMAQHKTELAARGKKRWSEILLALYEEEIARLWSEIFGDHQL